VKQNGFIQLFRNRNGTLFPMLWFFKKFGFCYFLRIYFVDFCDTVGGADMRVLTRRPRKISGFIDKYRHALPTAQYHFFLEIFQSFFQGLIPPETSIPVLAKLNFRNFFKNKIKYIFGRTKNKGAKTFIQNQIGPELMRLKMIMKMPTSVFKNNFHFQQKKIGEKGIGQIEKTKGNKV